jgi:Glycosyltransferase family 87
MESQGAAGTPTSVRARLVSLGLFALAVIGALAGLYLLRLHLTSDPLNDVHAYYDAGARLNGGSPLYPPDQDVNGPLAYFYPPLFAILFRPLALLPYAAAAAIWEAVIVASLVATVWWIGPRRRETWLAIGILALPIAWSVAIGQAQVPLTLLTAIGAPWSIALAANIKLFPALIACWWMGRREWRSLASFSAWTAGLAILQLVLAPQATLDFLTALTLKEVGAVRSFSPYALSPLLWAALVLVGIVVALRLARSRWGWSAAVGLSVLASPRLLTYMLMTLLACLRRPDRLRPADARGGVWPTAPRPVLRRGQGDDRPA